MDQDKINKYYSGGIEKDRLETEPFYLEGIRSKEIISRYLFNESMDIIDIGGGAGYYAFWLQQMGHKVSLIDLSPDNIQLAKSYSENSGIKLSACETGDATHLNFSGEQFDLALLLGPMYHLQNKNDRINALSEAKRILKPGGILLAAVISRYASLMDGFKRDLVNDNEFFKLMLEDLKSGKHNNPTGNTEYFTTAYFHTPKEIKNEILESGLEYEKTIAIEGFGWFVDDIRQKSQDMSYFKKLQTVLTMIESNEDLIAGSPHIMVVARNN